MKKPQKILHIWEALKDHKYPSLGLLIVLILLGYAYSGSFEITESHGNLMQQLWDWIDPVAGIMTFFTTLVIFGMQAYKNWEQSLEKRLNINYWYSGNNDSRTPVAKVLGAYLSGENDIRAWAQQLGRQMMGNLDFDMNWDDDTPPKILKMNKGKFFKQYEIDVYLTSNPFESDDHKKNVNEFIKRKFWHSIIKIDLDNWPIIWERMDQSATSQIQQNKVNPS